MSKLIDLDEGTFVRIPLEDGSFGYGRARIDPFVTFYNYRTTEPISDLDVISAQPVLFSQGLRLFDSDGWAILGVRPLDGEAARPAMWFSQSLGDYRKCLIFDTTGMERRVTPEECVGIERASVWDARHIAERLLDTFMGRDNAQEIRSRVRFEDYELAPFTRD